MKLPVRRLLQATIAFAVLSGPALAKPVTMYCVFDKRDSWIADKIFFEYDSARDAARVVDGIILHFEKEAKIAEITEDTAKKLVIRWRVNTKVGGQTTKMSYRLAYFKSNRTASVQAHPHGFANNYTARGRCQQIQQGLPTG